MASTATRKSNEVFLIGLIDLEPLCRLKQLPTTKQVLKRFHYHLFESKSVRNSSHMTIEEVLLLWSRAAIPTTLKKHSIEKLEKFHTSWLLLKKNKGRSSATQLEREVQYASKIDKLFDIAHSDASTLIKIQEDNDFLADQRGNRKMFMATEDKELAKKQERVRLRLIQEENRRQRGKFASVSVTLEQSNSVASCSVDGQDNVDVDTSENEIESPDSDNSNDSDFEPVFPLPVSATSPSSVKKIKTSQTLTPTQLFTHHVTGALDRNKTSDREAVRLIVPIVAALGCDPNTLPISRSTIHRIRKKARKDHAEAVMDEFVPCYPLVVHWDGKILPEIVGLGYVDRLPILISGDGADKLLGVPKMASGTGKNEANAVHEQLVRWNLTEKVQAMSFDTTSVNTGRFNGVCVLLENLIGRELMWLACRHHVLELILAEVFTLCFGPSSAPFIPIFKRFKTAWSRITLDSFRAIDLNDSTETFYNSTKAFLADVRKKKFTRDDYQEVVELTTIALGIPVDTIHWRAPGPVHHARWMAKLIYGIKIFLFRDQRDAFKLTKKEETQLHRFVQFGTLLYTKVWTEAPLAAEAPRQDLELWLDLGKYESIDREIAFAAKKVMEHHLWYLSDEAVGLSLFSDNVPAAEKINIVKNMSREPGERNPRGNSIILTDGVTLGDFASKRTAKLFDRFQIRNSFLSLPPDVWKENKDYHDGKEKIQKLRVVNDTAERGVKLFEEYNKLLTNNEKQFLLQVVENNRKIVPTQTTKKSAIEAVFK